MATAVAVSGASKAKLSTHVLDLVSGRPAAGMRIDLRSISTGAGGDESSTLVCTVHTNSDGRTDAPVLDAKAMRTGEFELVFHVAPYFTAKGIACPFLSRVPIRFTIFDATQGYHVPLLVTPWAFQTYRGS
jgi:5-hydroxyisourate hydrolase